MSIVTAIPWSNTVGLLGFFCVIAWALWLLFRAIDKGKL